GVVDRHAEPEAHLAARGVARRAVPGVPCRHDDAHAVRDEPVDLTAHRREPPREPRRMEWVDQRQIDAVYLELAAPSVALLDELERLEQRRQVAGAVIAQHLHGEDLGVRGHTADVIELDALDTGLALRGAVPARRADLLAAGRRGLPARDD